MKKERNKAHLDESHRVDLYNSIQSHVIITSLTFTEQERESLREGERNKDSK